MSRMEERSSTTDCYMDCGLHVVDRSIGLFDDWVVWQAKAVSVEENTEIVHLLVSKSAIQARPVLRSMMEVPCDSAELEAYSHGGRSGPTGNDE